MNSSQQTPYLDLIFESRNKAYGAYQLKRRHAGFLALAFLLSAGLIVGAFVFFGRISTSGTSEPSGETIRIQHRKVVGYSQLSAPPPIETMPIPEESPREPMAAELSQIATRKFLPPVVKPDLEIDREEALPTQKELKKVNPGQKTVAGDSIGTTKAVAYDEALIELDVDITVNPLEREAAPAPPPPPPPAKREAPPAPPPAVKEPEPEANKIYTFVEEPAQFPGGEPAMFRFIADHLVYPEIARENNIQGIILLQMTIETDGSISDIRIVRDIGGGCGEEAVRMVRSMPRWEPARQHTIHVRSSVVLPIKFELK